MAEGVRQTAAVAILLHESKGRKAVSALYMQNFIWAHGQTLVVCCHKQHLQTHTPPPANIRWHACCMTLHRHATRTAYQARIAHCPLPAVPKLKLAQTCSCCSTSQKCAPVASMWPTLLISSRVSPWHVCRCCSTRSEMHDGSELAKSMVRPCSLQPRLLHAAADSSR
jgi:hypothetical protein